MKMFKRVLIVGTGLIGGSIGMALKKKGLAAKVLGLSRRRSNALLAKRKSAIDEIADSLSCAREADLIILATPVAKILELAPKIAGLTPKDCLVIDVGSTKASIVRRLSRIFPGFVGSHPLAGTEKKGIVYASADMFRDSLCILTPGPRTASWALKKAQLFWKALGCKTALLKPAEHDRILAFSSHLPHAAAFSLISCLPVKALKLGSSGLKDTTRIASSDASLWSDIFMDNAANLLKAMRALETKLTAIKSALIKKERRRLASILSQSRKRREKLG